MIIAWQINTIDKFVGYSETCDISVQHSTPTHQCWAAPGPLILPAVSLRTKVDGGTFGWWTGMSPDSISASG
jgi:hypothetical protein